MDNKADKVDKLMVSVFILGFVFAAVDLILICILICLGV